jgi:L-lactate utilization protein LutC
MSSARDLFLARVRQAVDEGNRVGQAPPLESRGRLGEQRAGTDPCERFCAECTAAGAHAYLVADGEAAAAQVVDLVRRQSPRRVLLGRGPFLDPLDLAVRLRDLAEIVTDVGALAGHDARTAFFTADVGVSGVDYLIAETGSVVVGARPSEPRSLSLLPPVHIAVAERRQVLPDLFDLFQPQLWPDGLPCGLTVITGPSKTGDIELRLVTGVHGPGEVHVVLYEKK